jgi:hypothetical protein
LDSSGKVKCGHIINRFSHTNLELFLSKAASEPYKSLYIRQQTWLKMPSSHFKRLSFTIAAITTTTKSFFIALTTCTNAIKYSLLLLCCVKDSVFVISEHFRLVTICSLGRSKHKRITFHGLYSKCKPLVITAKIIQLKMFARDKLTSLFYRAINYRGYLFYNIDRSTVYTRPYSFKTPMKEKKSGRGRG